jgi:mannose-6-phosphate isomerase-like protein (cupin superfamily)
MDTGSTMQAPAAVDVLAPDGSEVRILLSLAGGSMAHFRLSSGQVGQAVRHRTVEEIWYILSGTGEMWRGAGNDAITVPLTPGTCLTIPAGTTFQFRCIGDEPVNAVAVTMPPWPGESEAVMAEGPWTPTPPPSRHR